MDFTNINIIEPNSELAESCFSISLSNCDGNKINIIDNLSSKEIVSLFERGTNESLSDELHSAAIELIDSNNCETVLDCVNVLGEEQSLKAFASKVKVHFLPVSVSYV